jgi:hypothetical protein
MCRVALRLGRAGRVDPLCKRHGVAVPDGRETLKAACHVVGISAAGLILPCYLIDLSFDTDFLSILMQAMLVAVALALIVAVWADQEE